MMDNRWEYGFSEAELRAAVDLCFRRELESLSAESEKEKGFPSEQFRARIEQLIRREKHRAQRKRGVVRFATAAAAVVLMVVLCFPQVLVEARDKIMEWYEKYASFQFSEKSNGNIPEYTIGFVPEGYQLKSEFYGEIGGNLRYSNGKNKVSLIYTLSGGSVNVDNEGSNLEIIKEGDYLLYYFKFKDKNDILVWQSGDKRIAFTLISSLKKDELMDVWLSIKEK